MDELTLYPAAELNPEEHHCEGVSLLDYMKQFRSLVFLDEGIRLLERGETVEKEYLQNFENRMEKGQIQKNQKKEIFSCTEILHRLNHMRGAALATLENSDHRLEFRGRYSIDARSVQSYNARKTSVRGSFKRRTERILQRRSGTCGTAGRDHGGAREHPPGI